MTVLGQTVAPVAPLPTESIKLVSAATVAQLKSIGKAECLYHCGIAFDNACRCFAMIRFLRCCKT